MDEQDYLIHYGVLGMKWGVRKAEKKGTNYTYTSMRTKHLTKKAAKARVKGKKNAAKIAEKAKLSKKSDKNYLAYAKKTSTGKAIAQNLLFGPGGARTYQSMRANGVSKGKALAFQGLTKVGGIAIGGLIGKNVGKALGAQIGAANAPQFFTSKPWKTFSSTMTAPPLDVIKSAKPKFIDLVSNSMNSKPSIYKNVGDAFVDRYNRRVSDELARASYKVARATLNEASEFNAASKAASAAAGARLGANVGKIRGEAAGLVGSGLIRKTQQPKKKSSSKKKTTSAKRKHSIK